jgi:aminopeptidase N
LPVDLKSQDIQKVVVNGHETPPNYSEGFIFLDVSKLKEGENHVAIQYKNLYDNDGSGCVSFIDVDKKQYLYTQFEPYYANRVFAQFDQPDLKAPMRLSLISPKIWKVLSNEYATT